MKIYVSGPMTGYPAYNAPAFSAAEHRLADQGHDVINPARHGIIEGWSWVDYMREALRDLAKADMVCVLPGWEVSRGASLEVHIAHALMLSVLPIEQVLL